MSTDLVEASAPNAPAMQNIFMSTPENKMNFATNVANILKDVVTKQDLVERIGKNDYIKFEGWSTMGVLLGILPREKEVIRHEDGSYEAHIDLIRSSDGVVVGSGSAICGMDESRWRSADSYARRSMAITRASGKAYRLSFGWVMSLAGYNPVPADEATAYEVTETKGTLYKNTDTQKKILAETAKMQGIEGKPELMAIAARMDGKPMVELADVCKAFAASRKQ